MDNSKSKSLETMLVLTAGSLLLYAWLHVRAGLYLAFAFSLTGILSGYLGRQVTRVWMLLAQGLGKVSNALLLTLVFLLVLTPVGIIRRLRGKDKLTRADPGATSNFISREHLFTRDDLENLW